MVDADVTELPRTATQFLVEALGGAEIPGIAVPDVQARPRRQEIPQPVVTRFRQRRSADSDVPESAEMHSLARWLARAAAERSAAGRPLPEVAIIGYGNGRLLDRSGLSGVRTGLARANAQFRVLSRLVRTELARSGLDVGHAGQLVPENGVRGESGRHLGSPEAAREAIAEVLDPEDGWHTE